MVQFGGGQDGCGPDTKDVSGNTQNSAIHQVHNYEKHVHVLYKIFSTFKKRLEIDIIRVYGYWYLRYQYFSYFKMKKEITER